MERMNMDTHIQPVCGETPSRFAERVGSSYSSYSIQKEKKDKGQFFTPHGIAKFMGSIATPTQGSTIRILDPGCGSLVLSCALIESITTTNNCLREVILDVYDTDTCLTPLINKVANYLKEWLEYRNITLHTSLYNEDFVISNHHYLSSQDLFDSNRVMYDYIISNPPYFKLAKDDYRTQSCIDIVDGQTNIYALFMAICSRMLKNAGEMIFITPRSFASGRYFQSFRNFLFCNVSLDFVHLFSTRKDTFAKDDVLQELIISKFTTQSCDKVVISYSNGVNDIEESNRKEYSKIEIVDIGSNDKIIFIPTTDDGVNVLRLFRSWDGCMGNYGFKISTGPVVAFRSKDHIVDQYDSNTVPLYWMHNVVKMLADHPVVRKNKGQFICISQDTKQVLLPNKNYIFLRRMSSKDDDSRLIAAPYFGNMSKDKYVGVENKLNYIYRVNGHLRRDETIGLAALLNSKLFDEYFRLFNGSINVSATELRIMPLPPIDDIRKIGNKIILNNNYSIDYINSLVERYFNIQL